MIPIRHCIDSPHQVVLVISKIKDKLSYQTVRINKEIFVSTSICCLSSPSERSHFFLVCATELSVLFFTYFDSMFFFALSSCKRSFKCAIISFRLCISFSFSIFISAIDFCKSLICCRLSSSLKIEYNMKHQVFKSFIYIMLYLFIIS